ncbi:glycosyltransferase [Pseudoalteromonas tetraodonis]|uniref:glycosyltransferase n=1 Tax=Pseudoalteromonas tetraodonis TaxID=43659 RepID=UPI003CFCC4A8
MLKRKVLFILPNLNSGGAERVAVNYLRQLDFNRYAVTLLVFKKTEDLLHLIPTNVELIDITTNSTYKSWWPLLNKIKEISPDLVYSTHSRVATLLMVIKPFVNRFYHIARMQGTPSLDIEYKQYGKFNQFLFSLGFNSADVVIAQTEEMKADGIKNFWISKENIKVLNNPIDEALINHSIGVCPFPSKGLSAVASGRLTKAKGFDVLLKSLLGVLKVHPNFRLYILGSEQEEFQVLNDLVKELGLECNVFFLGFVENPYPYYAYCDLFILSSRREGFPNVLLENYYLNTPIIASRCVPIVEQLIFDNRNGFTCEVNNVDDLSKKIIMGLSLKRTAISNNEYQGSSLNEFFNSIPFHF